MYQIRSLWDAVQHYEINHNLKWLCSHIFICSAVLWKYPWQDVNQVWGWRYRYNDLMILFISPTFGTWYKAPGRTWWRQQMETFPALLARSFTGHRWIPLTKASDAELPDVFFDLCLNKLLSKQLWGWWFETPSCSLWRHCNVNVWGVLNHILKVCYFFRRYNSLILVHWRGQMSMVVFYEYRRTLDVTSMVQWNMLV